MESTKVEKGALSFTASLPNEAMPLVEELLVALGGSGTHAMLKVTTGLAASAVLRDAILVRALTHAARSGGHEEARSRANAAVMHFLHPSPEGARDAVTRLVASALERALRMAPSARAERVDPLLAACTDIAEIVNAISTARFMYVTEEGMLDAADHAKEKDRGPKRRVTRDFEVSPPSSDPTAERAGMPKTPAPPRSTMRPTARGTLRPPSSGETSLADEVIIPRTQVRDAHGRPLKKKW